MVSTPTSRLSYFYQFIAFIILTVYLAPSLAQHRGGGYTPPTVVNVYDYKTMLVNYEASNITSDIIPLDNGLMGEQYDINTGQISFSQVDVSLPGNFELPVAFARKRSGSGNEHYLYQYGPLGDWQVDIPYIVGRSPSMPSTPGHKGTDNGDGEFSIGLNLNVPGQGQEKLRAYRNGVIGTENISPRPTYGTKQFWVAASISGGGFIVTSPSGDVYKLDRAIRRYAGEFKELINYRERITELDTVYYYPSEVKDVNGNWVKYRYNQYGPTQIYSSDNRRIDISYSGSRISQVSANGRRWTYQYTSQIVGSNPNSRSLVSVKLPDNRAWTYYTRALNTSDSFCSTFRNGYNPYMTVGVTHPNGTKASFKLKTISHYVKNPITASSGGYVNLVSAGPVRSHIDTQCSYGFPFQWSFFTRSLVKKVITTPDGETKEWSYDYDQVPGKWGRKNLAPPPGCCDMSKWAWGPNIPYGQMEDDVKRTVIDPEGYKTITYINRVQAGNYEGSVTKIEKYASATSNTPIETIHYDEYEIQRFPNSSLTGLRATVPSNQRLLPKKVRIVRGSDVYTTETKYNHDALANNFSYAQPVKVTVSSNLTNTNVPSTTRVFDILYQHLKNKWIIGLTKSEHLNGVQIAGYNYDALGRTTSRSQFNSIIARYAYHNALGYKGAISSIKDALGNETKLTHWKRGKPTRIARADNEFMTRVVDDNGWVTKVTDYNKNCTNYRYNNIGRLTLIDPCTSPWNSTAINYEKTNGNDGVSYLYAGMLKQTITKGNYKKIVYHDGFYRPVFTKEWDITDNSSTRYSRVDYDDLGRTIFASLPSSNTSASYGTVTSYDALSRPLVINNNTTPGSTTYAYLSNNRVRVNDNKGNVTTSTYVGFGGPSQEMLTHIVSPESVTTTMHYNQLGLVTTISQGGMTEYRAYGADKRLCKTVRSDVGNTAFKYNAKGELIWQASGSSVSSTPTTCDYSVSNADKVSFFYNNIGMVTNVNYGDSSPDLVYAYDAGNRIQKLTAGSVVNEYAYNSLNLLTQETMSVDGRTFTLGYAYNANGDLLSTTYPSVGSPITVIYAPNALGQATRVGSYASNASYHPNGMPASHQYGNGFRHTSTQFNSGLPNAFYDNKGGTYALSHRFTYDANNNITFLDDRVDSAYDLRLTYDGLDRLDTITDSYLGSGSVDYDTMGNIKKYKLGSRTINYSYNSKKQLAYTSGSKVYDFSYDSKGNVIDNGARTFNYNTANQMVQSGGFYYTYDGNGKRVKEVGSKGTSYSFYGSNGKLMSRFEDGQTINYYYLNSKLVAQTKGNEVSYLHSDYLGSPAAVTKATGNSIERMHYQPFGESIGSPKDDVGYTGHKFDTDLGLNYMQARYYDPVIGRFYSNDPVGFRDLHSFNRYAYANNNPYKYIDPTGMCSTDRDGNAVSGICPAPGDSDADELINDRLSDSNSIASSVESALNESGLIVYVDTTVVASATESVVTAAPDSSQPPGDQSGEVLIGLTPGSVVGTSGDSSDVGLIEFTAVEAFEHEFSHVSDSINGISPIGSGVITVSGAPVDRIANGVNTGLDEARAVNKTNRFRTKSGMNKQRTQY